MFKSKSAFVALSAVIAAACVGAYYCITRPVVGQSVPLSVPAPENAAPSAPRNEEVEREILNGIGSIRDLKPVPQQAASRR